MSPKGETRVLTPQKKGVPPPPPPPVGPRAPQLENTGALAGRPPILVSGAHSYRDGEWLYQDFLHDDHGATGAVDPNDPYGASSHLYSPAGGTFTYPTDKVYANNAADLVELRGQAAGRRDRLPGHAEHAAGLRSHSVHDRPRHRQLRCLAARRGRLLAEQGLPDLARPHRRPARRRRQADQPDAERHRRHDAPADHRRRTARGLEPRHGQGPYDDRRRPLGQGRQHLPRAAARRRDGNDPRWRLAAWWRSSTSGRASPSRRRPSRARRWPTPRSAASRLRRGGGTVCSPSS